jgi:hypothetical protein
VHQEQEQWQQHGALEDDRNFHSSTANSIHDGPHALVGHSGRAAPRDYKLPLLEKRGIKVKTASCAPISGDPVTTRSSSLGGRAVTNMGGGGSCPAAKSSIGGGSSRTMRVSF